MGIFRMKLWQRFCLLPFFTMRLRMLSRRDGFMVNWGLIFSTSELLYPNMKNRLRLIRPRPNFYMISDNPTLALELLIPRFTLVV